MKRKITDLTEERTFYNRYRDAFGNRVSEPYQKAIKRKVNTVQGGARFGHYIIDYIILMFLNVLLVFMGVISYEISPTSGVDLFFNVASILLTLMYYFTLETTLGYTVGKLITNSVVVDEYGEKPDATRILGRTFSRLIPFEALSCLSERGWHDKFSKTFVVTREELATIKRLQQEQAGELYVDDRQDILD